MKARKRPWVAGCLVLLQVFASASAAGVRPRKLHPVDEAPRDHSFLLFRTELIRAVRRHDTRFLLSHLDPQIVVNPYDDPITGIKGFVEVWRPADPRSDLWSELGRILSLGGAFEWVHSRTGGRTRRQREFVAPYVTSQWPEELDPMDYEAITARNVPVRARPSTTAPVVELLSYDIVKVDVQASADLDWHWNKITTSGGQQGYVADDQIRSASDTEAHFIKVHGRWRMTALFGTWGE